MNIDYETNRKSPNFESVMHKSPFTEAQLERIRTLCISRTQRLISQMAAQAREHARFGHSPSVWLLAEGSTVKESGFVGGPLVSYWMITADSAETLKDEPALVREPSGMYYSAGSAKFFIHKHEPLLWYDFIVGPRYGRGSRIEIAVSPEGEPYFNREGFTWIS